VRILDVTDDFGADEQLGCPCGHRVADHDAWGCVHSIGGCGCRLVPSEAIAAAEGGQ
jgi:hypothetical protein